MRGHGRRLFRACAQAVTAGVILLAGAATASAQTATGPALTGPYADVVALQKALDSANSRLSDWPNLGRYREANLELPPPSPDKPRVVFLGDSITDN